MKERIFRFIQGVYGRIRLFLSGARKNDVFYIGGSESLPPPLSAEEEAACIQALDKGEASARSALIEHNLRLVVYIAKKFEVSIDEPLNVDWDGNELLLSDILGTEPDVVNKNIEAETEKELLRSALSKLSAREREIMQLRFGLEGNMEQTQNEVADRLGISQSYISRLEKRIIKRLRK